MKKWALLFFLAAVSCKPKNAEEFLLKPKAFMDRMASTPGAVLLDVRTPDEVRKEYIKGALNIDFNSPEFSILIQGMDKTKPYFVYCAAGVRSSKAADAMRSKDFPRVYTLEGGLNAWKAAGFTTQVAKVN
jgi:rhodanese-related sulfurtransferase